MSDQRKSTTVLVVDDHPAIRSTMTDVLEAEGFIPITPKTVRTPLGSASKMIMTLCFWTCKCQT